MPPSPPPAPSPSPSSKPALTINPHRPPPPTHRQAHASTRQRSSLLSLSGGEATAAAAAGAGGGAAPGFWSPTRSNFLRAFIGDGGGGGGVDVDVDVADDGVFAGASSDDRRRGPSADADALVWKGYALLLFSSLAFFGGLCLVLNGPPLGGADEGPRNSVRTASYLPYLVPTLIPVGTYFVIARWVGEKYFRHS